MSDELYWDKRKDHRYYRTVRQWIEEFSPARSIVDVGCGPTPVVNWGEFDRRITVDPGSRGPGGVEHHSVDWLDFKAGQYSVITCLQCLEHQKSGLVVEFAQKLLRHADMLIVSVPYMWPPGTCETHYQDPVSLKKLNGWMGRSPDRYEKVTDNKTRLVALYRRSSR